MKNTNMRFSNLGMLIVREIKILYEIIYPQITYAEK